MGRTACTEPQCLYEGDLYLFLLLNKKYYPVHPLSCISKEILTPEKEDKTVTSTGYFIF